MEQRIDTLLAAYGHAASRTRAAELIRAGRVICCGSVVTKASATADDTTCTAADFTVTPPAAGEREYVSRGGYKLEHALREFGITPQSMRYCIDCGASTGVFTDCLLQHGAERVYTVDVGSNQLRSSLRNDPRVTAYENTDVRNIHDIIPPENGKNTDVRNINNIIPHENKIALITADLSFISLKHVFAVLRPYNCSVIALVKPQFETDGRVRMKRGVLKNERILARVVAEVTSAAEYAGFNIEGITDVPIADDNKNREKLLYLK